MKYSHKELKSLFISDVSKAINESQQIICSISGFSSFSDFYNYHLQHSHISTCQKEWSAKKQMSIHCVNCSVSPYSCFCLECFLNSNHQGHEYLIKPNSRGNCDCGDLQQWKRSGFCPKHQGLEDDSNPENYLDEKLRTVLTDTVFKAAFASLTHYFDDDGEKVSVIFQFLTSFLKFGDGFRRLLAISLTQKIHLDKIFDNIYNASEEFNQELRQFCGLLTNDQFFKNNFATINYKLTIEQTLPLIIKDIISDGTNEILQIWDSFWFHSYSLSPFKFNIERYNWDWVKFGLQINSFIKEVLANVGNSSFDGDNTPDLILANINLKDAATLQPNEQTQLYFDQFFSQILTTGTKKGIMKGVNDTIILTNYRKELDEDYFNPIQYFNYYFYEDIDCFVSKKNLKFDKLFEALEKTVDISQIFLIGKNVVGSGEENENDKFISRFIKQNIGTVDIDEDNYKSFHNGAAFFISYPLFYSFLQVFRNDEISRIKIARFFSTKKYQSLRVKLGILSVKNLLALICLHQSLTAKENAGAIDFLGTYINDPNLVNMGIPFIVPALQLLIGIQCNEDPENNEFCIKEFFAFEIAREIGVFDDFSSEDYEDENIIEKEKQMIFSFLYLMILLVVERTLFHFNGIEFIKEQIIFGLKRGISNLNNLKDMFDVSVVGSGRHMSHFNKIIAEVANAREKSKSRKDEKSGEQDVSFDLKETVECKNISAINSINDEKIIMNDEISKHPDQLIKIHNFEPEETFFFNQSEDNTDDSKIDSSGLAIKLKDLLMTPTVLAIIYYTLRSDSESSSQKVELNDHLAMSILILISKFVEEETENGSNKDEPAVINYDSTIVDLISQLKRAIFNYKVDEEQNATIQNTLTKKTFHLFLKTKIGSKSQTPRSFIEILLERGEIGKKVLNKMNVEFEGSANRESKQDISKIKKMRANKLKEDIMNHYKTITASFNVNDDQNDETLAQVNTEAEVCSICSTEKEKEILSFPLFIYRTKLPFIIDKPPVVKMPLRLAVRETEVFEEKSEFDDSIIEEEEEEENSLEDPEYTFALFLQENPGLDITDDLDEDQARERRLMIEHIHEEICKRYNRRKQELEEKKFERDQLKQKRKREQEEEKNMKIKALENPDKLVEKCCSPGNPFVIQFSLCQHLVHSGCVNEDDFACPIDRSFKNGFLPNINNLPKDKIFVDTNKTYDASYSNLTPQLRDALSMFMGKCSSFLKASDDKIIDFYVEMIKSISGLISTFEIRLRRLPDSLDSKKNKMLSRNLFLNVWYAYRMNEKPEMKTGFEDDESINFESKMSVFQRFIKKLIECDDPENKESLKAIISPFISSFISEQNEQSEKELFLFLRRVCLSYHFLLMNDSSSDDEKFIDWDEILSIHSLSNRFNVSFKSLNDEFELKPFNFSRIPTEFLRFGQAPYNFPVDQTLKFIVFDILDYNFLIRHFDHFSDVDENDEKTSDDYSKEIGINNVKSGNLFLRINYSRKYYPSVLLCIGSMASTIIVVNEKRMTFLRPIYLDRYGCADVGYKRRQPLFLNEDRYERFMDEILSGDFSNDLE